MTVAFNDKTLVTHANAGGGNLDYAGVDAAFKIAFKIQPCARKAKNAKTW